MIRAEIAKWLLYVVGAVVTLVGLAALLVDFLRDLQISEYGAFVALLAGALILIGTTYVFFIVPHYRKAWRIEQLRRHYTGRPDSELLSLNHDIAESAQAAIMQIEIATELYQKCVREHVNVADCVEDIARGKKELDRVNASVLRLKKYGDELCERIQESKT